MVLENVVRPETTGKIEEIDAKYELLPRGQYILNVPLAKMKGKAVADPKRPLEVLEARNAVQIAEWSGADRYAHDTYQKAVQLLDEAENYQERKHPEKKSAAMIAREAVQTAEDARLITLKRAQEEDLAKERQSAADREASAKSEASAEAQRRQQAEQARMQAQQTADQALQQQAKLEAARAAAEGQRQEALSEAEKARLAAEEANRMRSQAEQEKSALKEQLRQQLTVILETRSTARGLIVNMSDVLFDTGIHAAAGRARSFAKIAAFCFRIPPAPGGGRPIASAAMNRTLPLRSSAPARFGITWCSRVSRLMRYRGGWQTQLAASNRQRPGASRIAAWSCGIRRGRD